ncbi:MAG: transposase [Candidatus Parvarchaeota archaeon]
MKGIGTIDAATIVSEIDNIRQFDSALELQSYRSKVPKMTGSRGKDHTSGISKIKNSYLSNSV